MADIILLQLKSDDYVEKRIKPYIPLSALSISMFAKEEYNIKIIDLRIEKDWKRSLFDELKKNPICVGMTLKVGRYIKYGLEAARITKENSDAKVIVGGIHPSLMPKQTINHPLIDFVVQGEGEMTFLELVRALDKNSDISKVKGIFYKKGSDIRSTSKREKIDLNKLPETPYELIDMHDYFNEDGKDRELIMETSRGCLNRCLFCYNTFISGGTWRALSPEKVIQKIRFAIDNHGIGSFSFIDDNYFSDISRVKETAELLIKNKTYIKWSAGGLDVSTAAGLGPGLLKLLEKSGCNNVIIGAETGSKRLLTELKKNGTIEKLLNFNRRMNKYSIRPNYFFCVGFPGETSDDLKMTTKLILRLLKENKKSSIAKIFCYNPIFNEQPELFKEYSTRNGSYKACDKLEDWIRFDWKTADFPWLTKRFQRSAEALYFLSLFIDDKDDDSLNVCRSHFLRGLMNMYKSIARFRIKHLFFKMLIEKRICEVLKII